MSQVGTAPAALPQPDAAVAKREREVREVADKFEAVFVGEMTKIMMETVPEDSISGGGNAERIYKGMLSEQLGTAIVKKGGLGLAPSVMKEMIKMQGGQ